MMKRMIGKCKGLVAWVLVIVMAFSSTYLVFAYENENNDYVDFDEVSDFEWLTEEIEEFNMEEFLAELYLTDIATYRIMVEHNRLMAAQHNAVVAYNLLMENFLTTTDYGLKLVYPEHYAGAYVDYNMLVIQVTELTDEVIAYYMSMLTNYCPVRFKEVAFSLNELIMFGEMFVDALTSVQAPVIGFGFDTMNNVYNIILDANNADGILLAESFSHMARLMPIPISIELDEPMEGFSQLTGGSGISLNAGAQGHSVGITGYAILANGSRVPALATTGHAYIGRQIGQQVFLNGVVIGTLGAFSAGHHSGVRNDFDMRQFNNQGDWSVVILSTQGRSLMTNRLRGGQQVLGTNFGFLPRNTIASGTGRNTVSYSGVVMDVQQTRALPNMGIHVHGVTVVQNRFAAPQPGDSGGTTFVDIGMANSVAFTGVFVGASSVEWLFTPFGWFSGIFSPRLTP